MHSSTSVTPSFLVILALAAGCTLPQLPGHGELTTLKSHERLDLRAGAATTTEIGSFANDTYVEYSFEEREGGKMDACILPADEIQFWNANNQAHGLGCVEREHSATRVIVVHPGHYFLGFRCRNAIDTCVLTYDIRFGPSTQEAT